MAADPLIHSTAVIDPSARLGPGVQVGPHAVIGPDVAVGARTIIGPHAVLEYATVGEDCRIHAGAFIGTAPQDLKYKGEKTRAVIGNRTTVRECATVNRGTIASGETIIGENCLLMAYAHVAHDCRLGNNVIMANVATLGGHVHVGPDVVMGGIVAVHQFTRIGAGAMLGGGSMVATDIAPFCMTHGNRAVLVGLNVVGLRRRGLTREAFTAVKDAYRTVFSENRVLADALIALEKLPPTTEVRIFTEFLRVQGRGLCRPVSGSDAVEAAAERV
jgi:UDP-N-acetylglucosamine acyltransferase